MKKQKTKMKKANLQHLDLIILMRYADFLVNIKIVYLLCKTLEGIFYLEICILIFSLNLPGSDFVNKLDFYHTGKKLSFLLYKLKKKLSDQWNFHQT